MLALPTMNSASELNGSFVLNNLAILVRMYDYLLVQSSEDVHRYINTLKCAVSFNLTRKLNKNKSCIHVKDDYGIMT
jgi:hypothetical protein